MSKKNLSVEEKFKQIKRNLDKINFEELLQKRYIDNKNDRNNLSFWYPKIKCLEDVFIIPKTIIFSIPIDIYKILSKDLWSKEDDEAVDKFVSIIDLQGNYFVKSGTFSGKFDFDNCCRCNNIKNIKNNIRRIFYTSNLVGCPLSPEIVIREFINTEYDRPKIYNGLKLNTEFRIFYDFDKNQLLKIINYWDKETMIRGIYDDNDKQTFLSVIDNIEDDFEKESSYLEKLCKSHFSNINGLNGQWSIDFMLIKEHTFALIDMALAETSYYYNKIFE